MLRSIDEKNERQRALREHNQPPDPDLLTLEDCARALKISYSTARRLFRFEPGVKIVLTPGSRKPIIRVPREVLERVLRRSANP